eukprot:symbB.v1.2.016111.t1/scaffold1219.1/size131098/3
MVELLTASRPWGKQVTADNPLAAAHQIRQLTERGERPTVEQETSNEARMFLYDGCLRCVASERLPATKLLEHPWLRKD